MQEQISWFVWSRQILTTIDFNIIVNVSSWIMFFYLFGFHLKQYMVHSVIVVLR